MEYLWIFLVLSALQPIVQRKLVDASRMRQIAQIEKKRSSRVILLMHRQESMSILGFPVARYIDINDSEEVLRAISQTDPETPIDLILHTPGGLVLASLQIARAIFKHKGRVTAIVPHFAMSGGTLIAMACDEIVMSPHAVLGPVDPQLGPYPAASVLRVRHEKPIEHIEDQTLILADQAEKAIDQVRRALTELLSDKYGAEKADELARLASEGNWTHDRPITYEELKTFGHPVRCEIPPEFVELMSLYPQPVRGTRSVDYLPGNRSEVATTKATVSFR